ncbi:hypothetical protein H4Q26_016143 [Puccinia striiformis f. sp. tritici PST-130]|nr:hypothetical protein H4Q26_016143 [Puccinia striiformis f. sp. tritici PST-130]
MSEPDWGRLDNYSQFSDIPGDLHQAFKSLRRKYYIPPTTVRDPTRFGSVHFPEIAKLEATSVIQTDFLPRLRNRMNSLSSSLDLSAIFEHPESQFELMWQSKCDVAALLDQIQSATFVISSYHTPFQADVQHHMELKRLKMFTIREKIEGLISNKICQVTRDSLPPWRQSTRQWHG